MSVQRVADPISYYRGEAERVQKLAEAAEPGRGREVFLETAAEYRFLADYYEALPEPACEIEPGAFPTH
jgi:hypothetical protein